MSLTTIHKETTFGVGDAVRVSLKVKDGDKERLQIFEGMVIAIKNRDENKSFTVRRIGTQSIGIERIFPLSSPLLEKVEVVKRGVEGVKRSKLYYTRYQSPRQVEGIYKRALIKNALPSKSKSKSKKSK